MEEEKRSYFLSFSLQIRNFITAMHEYLLEHHVGELNSSGMELCDNAGHVVECTLQECILQPLSHFVYLRIEEYYATNGHLFQVQRSIHQGRLKTTEEMGIRVSAEEGGERGCEVEREEVPAIQ